MTYQSTKKNALKEKSLFFAITVVDFCELLSENRHNWRLSDQLLRSGTSIGANIREATSAESSSDFLHKNLIALKECRESHFWLEVLHGSKRITDDQYNRLHTLCQELDAMLSATVLTVKAKMGRNSAH